MELRVIVVIVNHFNLLVSFQVYTLILVFPLVIKINSGGSSSTKPMYFGTLFGTCRFSELILGYQIWYVGTHEVDHYFSRGLFSAVIASPTEWHRSKCGLIPAHPPPTHPIEVPDGKSTTAFSSEHHGLFFSANSTYSYYGKMTWQLE